MADNYELGMNGVLYFGASGTALAGQTEATRVKDLNVSLGSSTTDVTTRANSGYRGTAKTLKEVEISFQIQRAPAATTDWDAFEAAYVSDDPIAMTVLDGARDVAGSRGYGGEFVITQFDESQGLEDAIVADVTAVLESGFERVTISAS